MHFKSFFKGRMGSVITCIVEIVVGVLLLIDPIGFTSGIIIGAGVLMALCGLIAVTRYFLLKPEEASAGQLLFKGLLLLLGGWVCIVKHGWILNAFPLLSVLYAVAMLILAAAKLQKMADMCRMKLSRWYMPGIAAALSAVLAVIILVNPFSAVSAMWIFVAVSIIAEAIVELVTLAMK